LKFRQMYTAVGVATLLLSAAACGGSDDEGDDPIPGVDEGSEDPQGFQSPEEEASVQGGGGQSESEIELPEDVALVFDWEAPEDPDEAAALAGAADYMRSIAKGVVEQDPDDPMYQGLSSGQARDYARDQIQQWVDGGWTKTGTDRYYDAEIDQAGEVIGVEFCRDNSEMHGKEVESGEIVPEEETGEFAFLSHYSMTMAEAPGAEGFWQATAIEVEGDASQCAE